MLVAYSLPIANVETGEAWCTLTLPVKQFMSLWRKSKTGEPVQWILQKVNFFPLRLKPPCQEISFSMLINCVAFGVSCVHAQFYFCAVVPCPGRICGFSFVAFLLDILVFTLWLSSKTALEYSWYPSDECCSSCLF